MRDDPFGDLRDWGSVLSMIDELAVNDQLAECQPGLIRILRYKGNWRLREEVLKRAGMISIPSVELVFQVLALLDDDNTYYDARILAGETILQLLKGMKSEQTIKIIGITTKVVDRLRSIPQPPVFGNTLNALSLEFGSWSRSDGQ